MDLTVWSWIFLAVYIAMMLAFGLLGQRKVSNADDFATARNAYGPVFLAFAFAATTASGATFVGFPGIGYNAGMAVIWSVFLYPIGVYLGVLLCLRLVSSSGHEFGSRSIPEYLGIRYQSDLIRILVSLFSLSLFFYLAGQLVSGIVMFEIMLGLPPSVALGVTALVLMAYVVLGGAHADILTDGVQGFIMVLVGLLVMVLFLLGYGIEGGFTGMLDQLRAKDENLVSWLNKNDVLYHSWWSVLAVLLAHIPLGMLPHIGNKLWALKAPEQRKTFIRLAFTFGLILGMLGLGGIMARVILGEGVNGNQALALLFIELFPSWLAALLGVGILAAVMSTADGLVVSSSQIIANDLYRLTFVPRFRAHLSEAELEARVLKISRISTVVVMVLCTALAWSMLDMNVTIIVWVGTGCMMAAFAGPLILGAVWKGVTKSGAFAGLLAGGLVFIITFNAMIKPEWFEPGTLQNMAIWLRIEAPNPWSCAAMGEVVSVLVTVVVSKLTQPLPQAHLRRLFPA
ncbi:MAG: sodium:solute symporter family protein [Pseudomonadaceae bacterium]|nr:sodium:solute symporter family protein [Pseudomonadaceae bacterium]